MLLCTLAQKTAHTAKLSTIPPLAIIQTEQMYHTSTALMQHAPATPWDMEQKFSKIRATNKLSDKNYGEKRVCNRVSLPSRVKTYKAKSDGTARPPASFSQFRKKQYLEKVIVQMLRVTFKLILSANSQYVLVYLLEL